MIPLCGEGDNSRKDPVRIFTVEFKRQVVQQQLSGQKSLAELSRELDVTPIALRNWKRWYEAGATTAVPASEDVVPIAPAGGELSPAGRRQ